MKKLLTSLGLLVLSVGAFTTAENVQATDYQAKLAIEKQMDNVPVDEAILKGIFEAAVILDKANDVAKTSYYKTMGEAIKIDIANSREKAMRKAEDDYAEAMAAPMRDYQKRIRKLFETHEDDLGQLDVEIQKVLLKIAKEYAPVDK